MINFHLLSSQINAHAFVKSTLLNFCQETTFSCLMVLMKLITGPVLYVHPVKID